ncbi:MAG: diol dehydratase reactivase subunit alpha, partial [Desulfocucumaceae bacterium]
MKLVAGIDIGNSTTEVAIARVNARGGKEFIVSGTVKTTGVKGTAANIRGALLALEDALGKIRLKVQDLGCIYFNEAAPVITDVAMETITETIITESSMIGHDPSTPGGSGLGTGETLGLDQLDRAAAGPKVVVVVPAGFDFETAAHRINRAANRGVLVTGAILQRDDAVLLVNRLDRKIPVVDEVSLIDQVPLGVPAAVEVADPGHSVQTLSNP